MDGISTRASRAFILGALAAFCAFGSSLPVFAMARGAEYSSRSPNSDLLVIGQVEKIDLAAGLLVVTGQPVLLSNATVFLEDGVPAPDPARALSHISINDVLVVTGIIDSYALSVDRLSEPYVPGSTNLFVRGRVEKVDSTSGLAVVNGLTVDYTPAMGSSTFTAVEKGDVIEARGIRPSIGGTLLASAIKSVSNASVTNSIADAVTGTSQALAVTGTSDVRKRGAVTGTSQALAVTGTSDLKERGAVIGRSAALAVTGTSTAL